MPITRTLTLALATIAFLLTGCTADLHGTVTTNVAPSLVAGRPIILTLTVLNTGKDPFTYWCGGPGPYPTARLFDAALISEPPRHAPTAQLTNGQYEMGSGTRGTIAPGKSMEVPATLPPLPAGRYRLTITSQPWHLTGQPIDLVVTGDPAKTADFDHAILAQIRQRNPLLARHIARTWPTPAIEAGLVTDLQSPDPKIAVAAASVLYSFRPFPPGTAHAIAVALHQQNQAPNPDTGLVVYLVELAARDKSDETLPAVIAIAHRDMFDEARWRAILALAPYPQPAAAAAIREFLQDPNPRLRLAAATDLAPSQDPAALTVLLALATGTTLYRGDALYYLGHYPDSKQAAALIQAALWDPLRSSDAKRALRLQQDAKSRRPAATPPRALQSPP